MGARLYLKGTPCWSWAYGGDETYKITEDKKMVTLETKPLN